MDLTSDHPFWFVQNGLLRTHPPIEEDQSCDVAIVGAGITGAIVAHRLASRGLSVVVLDRRDVCTGSTCASTALIQYEIDVPLVEMAEKIGKEKAERAYRLSYESIDRIDELVASSSIDCGFERKISIYLAPEESKRSLLEQEAEARTSCGIPVRLLDKEQLAEQHSLRGCAALVSQQAASCDPYRLAHGLLENAIRQGAKVFDRTSIDDWEPDALGVRLTTNRGPAVSARNVVFATGYEAHSMLREKVVDLRSTYAVVSQPLPSLGSWNADWMM